MEPLALMDHLILENIFSNLSLGQLKVARLVCKDWNPEALKYIKSKKKINIHLNPGNITYSERVENSTIAYNDLHDFDFSNEELEDERKAMRDFLVDSKLPHILHVSLLGKLTWACNNPNILSVDVLNEGSTPSETYFTNPLIRQTFAYIQQENNLEFAQHLITDILPTLTPLVKELRLEMNMRTDEDYELLDTIVELVEKTVERVFIHLVSCAERLPAPRTDHKVSVIKTLGIRILDWIYFNQTLYGGNHYYFPIVNTVNLLALFPNAEFFDSSGPRKSGPYLQVRNKLFGILFAYMVGKEDELQSISGLRTQLSTIEELHNIVDYSNYKRVHMQCLILYASLDMCFDFTEDDLKTLLESIPELEALDFIWKPIAKAYTQQLPPNLKFLTCTSSTRVWDPEWHTSERENVENLNDLFGLGENFPQSLESLRLILMGEDEIWNRIFPPASQLISKNITSLAISLVGECESDEIQKFPRIHFPNLRIFRHGRSAEEGRLHFVCQHKYDGAGKPLGKWKWLGAVRNYFYGSNVEHKIDYLHTLRYKYCLGLEHETGFTDTMWDLENEKHHVYL